MLGSFRVLYVMFEREARELKLPHFLMFSPECQLCHLYHFIVSLIYITGKSLEYQHSNINARTPTLNTNTRIPTLNITKTQLAFRARTQVRGKKDLEEILLRESSGRVNVWALCDEPPLFADNTNKTALKRQTESLKRLAEYLEKQRLLDLELKKSREHRE